MHFLKWVLLAASLLVLASCLSDGSSSGGSNIPSSGTLGGVAAVGIPIVNGNIRVICAAGGTVAPTATNSNGAWSVTLSGQTLPCAVEVSGGTINGVAKNTSYGSIAISPGTVNVTPLTDLLVANLVGTSTPSLWFAGLSTNPAPLAAISQAQLNTALTRLGTLLNGLPPLSSTNPVTTTFMPTSGNVSDDMLTALATAMTNTGVAYDLLLINAANNTDLISGFNTILANAYADTASGGRSETASYTVGGSVSGLTGSVVLQDNGGDSLTVTSSGTFTFATKVVNGNAYSVTVLTQPAGQTCTVSTGAGAISGSNITNVAMVCSTKTYTVGGTVTGPSGDVVLQVNGGGNLTIAVNGGSFTFPTALAQGSAYNVTVLTQPGGQTCFVAGGGGTATANVTGVMVNCIKTPSTLFMALTATMLSGRARHTATLLPDGQVFIAGGDNLFPGTGTSYKSAELYNPLSQTFTALTAAMTTAREAHAATLLPSGQVLLTGGFDCEEQPNCNSSGDLNTAELYDPVANIFTALTANMTSARSNHTATLLPSGKVLITGGSTQFGTALKTAELYDPVAQTFVVLPVMMTSVRTGHTATLLPNGKVLLTGGFSGYGNALNTAEVYDPVANTFKALTATMTTARAGHAATLLPNGKVLLSGGVIGPDSNSFTVSNTAELYDPTAQTFTALTPTMTSYRAQHTATLLPNGQVFLTGGGAGSITGPALDTVELYTP